MSATASGTRDECLSTLRRSGRFSLDLETAGLNPRKDRILSFNITCAGKSWGFPFVGADAQPYRETLDAFRPVLHHPEMLCVGHNIKFDLQCLWQAGYDIQCRMADTMLAAYLLDESLAGSEALNLRSRALVELGRELKPFSAYSQGGDLFASGPGIEEKGVQDTAATLDLWLLYEPRLKKDPDLWKCFWDLLMPLVPVIAEMEMAGVTVDLVWMSELKKQMERKAAGIEEEIAKISGRRILVSSTEQVSHLLFHELGLEPKPFMRRDTKNFALKKSLGTGKTLWSTKEEVLVEYKDAHPVVPLILDHRSATKLANTYLTPFLTEAGADPEHRLRTHFWMTGTESGRLSSSDPVNLQNLPREKDKIRRGIIAAEGHTFIEADFSQLELRLMADRSRDANMLRAYMEDKDIHQMTQDALSIKNRTAAKNCNFGIIYDMSPAGLQRQLWLKSGLRVSLSECERWIMGFFQQYAGVKRYHNEIRAQMDKNGYVKSLVGRYRRVKKLMQDDPGYAFRVAVNFTIQGAAADLTGIAMRNLQREIVKRRQTDERWRRVRQVAQVHDALCVEAPEEIGEEALELVKSTMEKAVQLPSGTPVMANAGRGRSWQDAEADAKRREDAKLKKSA